MPVTFNTDLKDLKNFDYVPEVPLDALFKNLGYKQAKYDQDIQQTQQAADALRVKAYGQDIPRRDEIINEVNKNLQKFAGQNMSDPNVKAQFMGYVGSVANSPEILGMQARATAYDKANAKKERLMADGKTTISPHNDPTGDMINYFNGGEQYNPAKRFSGDVFVDYDFNKLHDDIITKTPEIEEMKKAPNGQQEYYKGKATAALYANYLRGIEADPNAKRELDAQFKADNSGVDLGAMDYEHSLQKAQAAADNAAVFSQLLSDETDPNKKAYLQAQLKEAQDHENHWKNFGANVDPVLSEKYAKQDWLNSKAMKYAETNTNYALKDQKTNDLVLQNNASSNALNNAIAEANHKLFLANASVAIDPTTGKPVVEYHAGDKQPVGNRSGVKVNLGNVQYDYEFIDQQIAENNPAFITQMATAKGVKISKGGKTLVETPLTSPTQNPDGTYTIRGKFTDGTDVKTDSVTVTARDIGDAFLGNKPTLTKKFPPTTGVLSTDQKKFTVGKPLVQNGVTILKAGDVIPVVETPEAAKDTAYIGKVVWVKSTNKYTKVTK